MFDRIARAVKKARRSQLVVVGLGMVTGFMLPAFTLIGDVPPWFFAAYFAAWIGTPLSWLAFSKRVDEAAAALGVQLDLPTRGLALAMFLPGLSLILEPIVVHRLARRTELVVDSPQLASKATMLAVARAAWIFVGGPLAGVLFGAVLGIPELGLVLSGLGGLVLLGLATQVVVQPLLDRADQTEPALLGAVGADSPVAFSSTGVDARRR
jgi:hypothetical protein